jgi:hypothetical protein
MLNFVRLAGTGGSGFRWSTSLSSSKRDSMLSWMRSHDTLAGGKGSDPHGWRNALNYYGWGSSALSAGKRVYEDYAFTSYSAATKAAVRAMIKTRKPVGMIGWAGRHAQMITGYYGLSGDPFARTASGSYSNAFTISGFYFSDPLRADGFRNVQLSYTSPQTSSNLRLRFRTYRETDSPYDDRYTPGIRASKNEWYGKYVVILPIR